MNTLRWIWMHFTPRSASSSSLDAYVGGSQSLRYAKTSLPKVCIPSSHPCPPLVLISTPKCIAGLRSKTPSANLGTITATSALAKRFGEESWPRWSSVSDPAIGEDFAHESAAVPNCKHANYRDIYSQNHPALIQTSSDQGDSNWMSRASHV